VAGGEGPEEVIKRAKKLKTERALDNDLWPRMRVFLAARAAADTVDAAQWRAADDG
jgi:hypothetical protein